VRVLPSRFEPGDLVASRTDAVLVLAGTLGFFGGGFGLTLLGGAVGLTTLVVLGVALAASGVIVLNGLGRRTSRRLQPGRIGPLDRWLLESRLGMQWIRPSVLRRALHVARHT
jgi:hypothetical protein